MMRLQNVSTRRKDKINSDEEERLRLGYETQSGFRYAVYRGLSRTRRHWFAANPRSPSVELRACGDTLAHQPGVDETRGQEPVRLRPRHRTRLLATQRPDADDDDVVNSPAGRTRHPLCGGPAQQPIFEPKTTQSVEVITSLAYALKNALLVTYQLEDDEVPVSCYQMEGATLHLLYEAAEGGAGVLRRLLKDPLAFPLVAREALRICHFNPDTGEDEATRQASPRSARHLL